ncbi:unnamed protein product [Rotaria sordida]|uniref:Uncharacterized protein n=1 Tax=Rotaria sordida TaxID=392033 RepID=A0A814Z4V2_9BILA|nr:unnamed protein product [Rotaria sordida]
MKCLALIAALCFFGVCAGQGVTMDFLTDNVVTPMLDQIYQNAINLLGQQITSLFGGLFGGKRALPDLMNMNIGEVVTQFTAQVKQVYQRLFNVFLQIVQHVENWMQKPNLASIEFARAGAEAQKAISQIKLGVNFLQPLVNLVQTHLQALIPDFEGIIQQVFGAIQQPIQSLIGTGSLLQP